MLRIWERRLAFEPARLVHEPLSWSTVDAPSPVTIITRTFVGVKPGAALALRLSTPESFPVEGVSVVYAKHVARTNIDIDEDACQAVMKRYGLSTKREAVNLALRTLAAEPLSAAEARSLRGSGWDGSLEHLRAKRVE